MISLEDNPYSAFLKMVREQAENQIPVLFRFGKVITVSPLKIDISETVQDGNNLLKNEAIGELHIGDSVLLVSLDGDQTFIVLCKVVGV